MKTVHLTVHDGKLMMDQDYEFLISDDTYFSNDMVPFKEVKFNWNLHLDEIIANSDEEKEEELLEEIGNKLKHDFIAFMHRQNHAV